MLIRARKRDLFTLLAALAVLIMAVPSAQRVFASSHGKTSHFIGDVSLGVASNSSRPVATTECSGPADCTQVVLSLLNQDRAKRGVAPLTLSGRQSHGSGSCVGSIGHTEAMQQSGSTWHSNPSYPSASFPNDICISHTRVGENAGETNSGDELSGLQQIEAMFMTNPHSRSICATIINHACNIISPKFHRVGIGIVYANNGTWVTEDFTN